MEKLPDLKHVIVLDDYDNDKTSGTISFDELLNLNQLEETYMDWVDREDGMILHYTSGSTGKPKGILQVHDAMVHQYLTGKWVCDFRPGDIYLMYSRSRLTWGNSKFTLKIKHLHCLKIYSKY
jgi:acetyl-CoA synthetase